MDISEQHDILNQQVTAAIFRVEQLPRGSAEQAEAWLEVSAIEEQIASLIEADLVEGAIARRGAVTAAMHAKHWRRAYRLVESYIWEYGFIDSSLLDKDLSKLVNLRNSIVSQMKGDDMATATTNVEAKTHPWAFWFGKPVLVQLREPLALFVDGGGVEVEGVTSEGENVTHTYGKPLPVPGGDKQGPPVMLQLPGRIDADPVHPDRVILVVEVKSQGGQMRFLTSVRTEDISYVTMIPEHAPQSKLSVPQGGIITP